MKTRWISHLFGDDITITPYRAHNAPKGNIRDLYLVGKSMPDGSRQTYTVGRRGDHVFTKTGYPDSRGLLGSTPKAHYRFHSRGSNRPGFRDDHWRAMKILNVKGKRWRNIARNPFSQVALTREARGSAAQVTNSAAALRAAAGQARGGGPISWEQVAGSADRLAGDAARLHVHALHLGQTASKASAVSQAISLKGLTRAQATVVHAARAAGAAAVRATTAAVAASEHASKMARQAAEAAAKAARMAAEAITKAARRAAEAAYKAAMVAAEKAYRAALVAAEQTAKAALLTAQATAAAAKATAVAAAAALSALAGGGR